MQTFLTDVHNHSKFSFDGVDILSDMLAAAQKKGVAFYGVSEHFDGDVAFYKKQPARLGDTENYFHTARHLQEDYAGVMNVFIGCEFSYADEAQVHAMYKDICEKHRPDFAVNSVHTLRGDDYWDLAPFYDKTGKLRDKNEVYAEYLALILKSLDAPYPYDILGHIGYAPRYAPYEDKPLYYAEHALILDEILKTVIGKDKILEANAANFSRPEVRVLDEAVLRRYYALGGRAVSYASDAHSTGSILRECEAITTFLKEVGFTHVVVPCQGERIKIAL